MVMLLALLAVVGLLAALLAALPEALLAALQ